ncbi:MAG: nucleotidyltransferase family protein [Clostridia bacterium]|nr:nucleotidyltransferase family protein [Clostridia bacterium]
MICLILAAGYATRLYPLTENFPKPLLKVGEKTILDHLTDDINSGGRVKEFVVVSNHKYAHHFEEWAKTKSYKITVVDDGTSTNETRLGAVKDMKYAIDRLSLDDDMLIIAGDNVLDFSLNKFVEYSEEKNASCVMRYFEKEEKKLNKCGVLELENDDLILNMEEKPEIPKSNWCCPPFYIYKKEDIARIDEAINDGCGVDAPGSLVSWICKKSNVYAFEMPGSRYDIGNLESYEKVQREYKGITK